MKRTAVLALASFYLLLTTGAFVCIVHCAAKDIFNIVSSKTDHHHDDRLAMNSGKPDGHHKNPCKGGKGCNCCDKHGSYVIKENIKPTFDLNIKPSFVAISYQSQYSDFHNQPEKYAVKLWADSHAPPLVSGKKYLIQICTLLI